MQKRIQTFDKIFQAISSIKEVISTKQLDYTVFPVNYCKEECIKRAVHLDNAVHTISDQRDKKQKLESGEWFVSLSFRKVIVHMQLLEAIHNLNFSLEKDILETFVSYVGNGVCYDIAELDCIMEYATRLYFAALKNQCVYKSTVEESTKLLISSIKVLKKEGLCCQIIQGEPQIEQDSEKRLITKIDMIIKQIGGFFVINQLFDNEISKHYDVQLGRYLIHRNKHIISRHKLQARIPYNYLLQLSLKYLQKNVLLQKNYMFEQYDRLLLLSKSYFEVLQLQGYSVIEELLKPLDNFPFTLCNNMCFEKMYIPRQYHPDYINMLLHDMLEPFWEQANDAKPYSFHDYVHVAKYILGNSMGPTIFYIEDLKGELHISKHKLNGILQDICMNASQVNQNFMHYMDETNAWKKPLIKLNENQYFCLDGRMSGFAFYEAMYQILYQSIGPTLSREQGRKLENMIYKMFKNKQIPYQTGKYKQIGSLPERDCDMILESQKYVMFLEIKKCPLPSSYEQGDDVSVLRTLGEGMLFAQEQILWHKLRLKRFGVLELYNSERSFQYTPGNKCIIATSVCMPEYDFLTERSFSKKFLESILYANYHAVDPNQENKLNALNKRLNTITSMVHQLYDSNADRKAFFNSQFRSLQQIWTMLQFCENVEEFLEMCHQQLLVVTGAEDVYVDILSTLQLSKHIKL